MALELGLFSRHGLNVELVRQVGWATARDRLVQGEVHAIHALAAMPFAATLESGGTPCPCVTPLIISLQGNAITLARHYWREGARDARSFGELVREQRNGSLVFGVVSPVSTHRWLMETWLAQAGLSEGRDYRLVTVPPPQLPALIKAGHLDGFCVGEPWNSVAVESGLGWCPATSVDLAPGHPEKVLMTTARFAADRGEELARVTAAVLEACAYCAVPRHADEIARTLSARPYLNTSSSLIARSFSPGFDSGAGGPVLDEALVLFHGEHLNRPDASRGCWVLNQLVPRDLLATQVSGSRELVRRVFREDLFQKARTLSGPASNEFEPNPEPDTEPLPV